MSREKRNGTASRRKELLAAMETPDKVKEAAAVLEADRQKRANLFLAELQALCQKYRCELTPMLNVVAK